MKIHILSVGKVRKEFIRKGETEYIKRIERYIPLKINHIKEEKIVKNRKNSDIINKECERLIKIIPKRSWLVTLDRNGTLFSSENFARFVSERMNAGTEHLTFIIGGALGLCSEIKNQSHTVVSLSKMTFTHEMSRLILLEQIYRSLTILKGEQYHK